MTVLDKEMPSKRKKKTKQHYLFYRLISYLLIGMSGFTCFELFSKDIFKPFYLISITLIIVLINFVLVYLLNKRKLKALIKNFLSFITIIIIILELIFDIFGVSALKFLSNITDTGYRVETYGVYVLNDSKYHKIKDLNNKTINNLTSNDEVSEEANKKLAKQIKYKGKQVDSIDALVKSLDEADAVFFPVSYEDILREEFEDLYNGIKLIDTIDVVEMVNTIQSKVDLTKEPFAIYISGIDTTLNIASKARSDVNIIVGVNPNTKEILIVNTPRDYYVTLASKGREDKLTHAGLYGVGESLETLSNLYDVDISYYVRVNFTSFIKIVDALGGIEVDVPKDFCEQDSNRSHKAKDLICLKKGHRTLNGEQALAFARHRKTLPTGDRARGENQMKVLEAIIDKSLSPSVITKYNKLIDSLEGRVLTNMTSSEMFKFAKKQIKEASSYKIRSISANGEDGKEKCYSTGSAKAYVMKPNQESVNEIKEAFASLFNKKNEVN